MAQKQPKRPRDFSQAAKLVIDIASGQVEDHKPPPETPAVEFARSGLRGGRARAEKLSPKQRQDIAKAAARARWRKREPEGAT
jgi:hypothetical protein